MSLIRRSNKIPIFGKTEYAELVHQALTLYQQGKYIESKEPWEEALRQNSLFDYANKGLGQAYYKLEQYDEALTALDWAAIRTDIHQRFGKSEISILKTSCFIYSYC